MASRIDNFFNKLFPPSGTIENQEKIKPPHLAIKLDWDGFDQSFEEDMTAAMLNNNNSEAEMTKAFKPASFRKDYLERIQTDARLVAAEIQQTKDALETLNTKLENLQIVEKGILAALDVIALPPDYTYPPSNTIGKEVLPETKAVVTDGE